MRDISRERAADDPHPVLERQCSRDDGGGHLTHRVPDDRARAHPVRLHRRGQCHLHGEERGLDPVDSGHRLAAPTSLRSPRTRIRARSAARARRPLRRTPARCQQFSTHPGPLRALPGEHPHRPPVVLADRGPIWTSPSATSRNAVDQLLTAARRSPRSARAGAHADGPGCRPGQTNRLRVHGRFRRHLGQPVSQPARGSAQLLCRGRRQREQQRARDIGRVGAVWSSGSGACSTIACTFVPDSPYADTAARRGCSPLVGHAVVAWAQRVPSRSSRGHQADG